MSFILKSVELKNIRAHEYFLFEPALTGTTAISGDNGTGKSTIVDAFAWCLYGTRPSGTKNRNLISDNVDPKTKPVSVKSIINIGGIDYAIERKIITIQGATECNVWGRKPGTKEYSHVAGPSVTHVEKFIKAELGMNEKGFLTSVLIQQKQVDQIVSATPRERGVVIEELTGIASITQAIQKTNEDTRALEKAASIFKIGNVDEAKLKVEEQKEIVYKIEQKELQAIDEFKKAREESITLNESLKVESEKVNKRIQMTQEIDALKKQIEFLKKQAEEDIEYIEKFKDKHGSTFIVDLNKLKKDVESKRRDTYDEKSNAKTLTNELNSTIKEIKNCDILKMEFENESEALNSLKISLKKQEQLENELEKLNNDKILYSSEIKHSKASHEHISGKEENCPVCKSSIENPEKLRKEIEDDIKEYQEKEKETLNKIKEVSLQIKQNETKIKEINIAIEAIKEQDKLTIEKGNLKSKIKASDEKLKTYESDLSSLEREYEKALRIEADKKALDSAKRRSLTVHVTINENEDKINVIEKAIKKLNSLSDRSYNSLIKKTEDTKNKLNKMLVSGQEIRGKKILQQERLKNYEENLATVEESMRKYEELAEQIEVSNSAATMLSTFKADRIKDAIPTLEFFASDFLSKFTGGAFTKLSVDKKFNTFVTTESGVVRPVAQLSGGELSSASIALRLGIAMLLNSSDKNVLILDEVLVSMDEDRSRQIMETIGSMTNSQVIFIAHNSDINSIADKTILVTK